MDGMMYIGTSRVFLVKKEVNDSGTSFPAAHDNNVLSHATR